MKTCPTCKRIYADDTLTFCLEDGTRLSPAYDPDRTEILPAGLRPTEQAPPPSHPRTTIPAPPPQYTYGSQRPTRKRGSSIWIVLAGIAALGAIALIVADVFFVWKANRQASPETLASSSPPATQIPSASPVHSVNASPSPRPSPSPTPDLNWLNGVWQGEGFQTDTKTTWTARLTARGENYSIEYPDIPCSGEWKLIDKNSHAASFTELITQGTERCVNNSHVMVEKVSASEISARFTNPGSRNVIATVTMSKKQ